MLEAAASSMTMAQQRKKVAQHVEVGAYQQLFFETYGRQKRCPPTPVASQINTPQEGANITYASLEQQLAP